MGIPKLTADIGRLSKPVPIEVPAINKTEFNIFRILKRFKGWIHLQLITLPLTSQSHGAEGQQQKEIGRNSTIWRLSPNKISG